MCNCERSQVSEVKDKYATSSDFCRIFGLELKSLYQLAFLLTTNHAEAEQCMLSSLDEALRAHGVHSSWAYSWSKRTVIKQCVQLMTGNRARGYEAPEQWDPSKDESGGSWCFNEITQLGPLERFVFVASILENICDRECSMLFGCAVSEVAHARMRALEQLSNFQTSHWQEFKESPLSSAVA